MTETVGELYLELMKRCLTNTVYSDPELIPIAPDDPLKRWVVDAFKSKGIALVREKPASVETGRAWGGGGTCEPAVRG